MNPDAPKVCLVWPQTAFAIFIWHAQLGTEDIIGRTIIFCDFKDSNTLSVEMFFHDV